MDIFVLLELIGGLALFLYGMRVLSRGLEALSGERLEVVLAGLCRTPLRGVLLGTAVTAVIQSSSATTVMVVGLVNSGLMLPTQSVGVIMGANLGTTATSWLLSLTGLESESVGVRLLKPSSLAPMLMAVGAVLALVSRKKRASHTGEILSGLGILFFGMQMMSDAVRPLSELPAFADALTLFSSPIAGLLAGAVLTAMIQSSSASIGILQAVATGGGIGFSSAFPIILGQNIGTCVTTLLSSLGTDRNAKRAAFVHLYFNVVGTAVAMAVFYGLRAVAAPDLFDHPITPVQIALTHTLFNVLSIIILFPFSGLLLRLADRTVAGRGARRISP